MAVTSSAKTTNISKALANRAALRIVLFGRTDAGKSSLLGALFEAVQTQEHLLQGHMTDLSKGLAELQQQLYEGAARETLDEIIPYAVAFEPFGSSGRKAVPPHVEAVLVDCDGRVANELLARRRTLTTTVKDSRLVQMMLTADAIILVVDASVAQSQIDADFAEFARFLRLFEEGRGHHTEVGGMPVFLVLTKCDLLAKPTDTASAWIDQIEERKRQVDTRFKAFMVRHTDKALPAFGRVDLHLWATSVKRPELAGSPAKPREPFGVAELFRQCLDGARVFRRQRERSRRRLFRIVAASFGFLLVGSLLVVLLPWLRGLSEPGPLETVIDRYRIHEQDATPRARYRQVSKQIATLQEWMADPGFADLPEARRAYVQSRLEALQAFQDYENKIADILDPRDAQSMAQLTEIETALKEARPAPEYWGEWSQTDVGRQQTDWISDTEALRQIGNRALDWYQGLTREGSQVLDSAAAANLPARAKKVLDRASVPPFPEKDPDKLLPGAGRATYANAFAFPPVAEARRRWEDIKKKLAPAAKLEGH